MSLEDLSRQELIDRVRRLEERLVRSAENEQAPRGQRQSAEQPEGRTRFAIERALRLSRSAVDTAREAIFTIEPTGNIVDVNTTGCDRLGYSRDELIGMSTEEFDVRFEPDKWPDYLAKIRRRGSLVFESEHRTKSGHVFPVEIAIAYFQLEGEEYLCSFVRDVTERKRAEQRQARYQKTLQEKNAMLEAQNAELEEFSYALAHDLKSPLITIKSFTSLVRRDFAAGQNERIGDFLHRIGSAANTMSALLGEISLLVRAGSPMATHEDVPLTELVDETLRALSGPIASAGAEVRVVGDLPVVTGSRNRLGRVLQNLLDNSIKFMAGQPRPVIEIGSRSTENEVIVYVEDNGVGIDPQDQEKVFRLFLRLDETSEGTGLGLALVKKIIDVHGGRVWVESEGKGQGARFCVALPRVDATVCRE